MAAAPAAAAPDAAKILETLSTLSLTDPAARRTALALSRQLTVALDDPVNTATELVFSPFIATAARIAVDLDIFTYISNASGPSTTETLAEATKCELQLLTRVLRLLAAVGFVHQADAGSWEATPVTKAMALPSVAAGHRFVWDILITSAVTAPSYLLERTHALGAPTTPTDGFVQYAHRTKYNIFSLLASRPARLADFNAFMGNTMGTRRYWVDWWPVKERILDGAEEGGVLVVDVGGGRGHDLVAFAERWPGRRLVLQDLPQGFEGDSADGEPQFERMVQNFFEPQQVVGARAYFLHHILHDWSDEYCIKILGHLRNAMRPGYSKLLLHELILPDCNASTFQCVFDMTMMTFNGGVERSRGQWTTLLEQVGFQVTGFWDGDGDGDGLVEAVVKN